MEASLSPTPPKTSAKPMRSTTCPKADKVEVAPVKPQPAPSKPEAGKPSMKWGVVKEAYDEKVLVAAAWDETVVVRDAWTETINHPAETKTVHHDAVYGWI